MKDSPIEWTDHTLNPWEGCVNVSPGCVRSYAEELSAKGEGPIQVIQWPAGEAVFFDGTTEETEPPMGDAARPQPRCEVFELVCWRCQRTVELPVPSAPYRCPCGGALLLIEWRSLV